MKYSKLYHFFFTGKICLYILILVFSLAGNNISAQKKSSKKTVQFEGEVSFATIYDNNILKYSEKYLDRFMSNLDFGRFHIETYDDVILYQSAELAASYRIFKDLKSRININFNNSAYVINGIKNWYYVSIGFQQYLTKKASFKILYSYIPSFYVRHFRDEDWVEVYGYTPETFVPFGFSKDNYGFWAQNTFFKDTRVRLSLDYSTYYYNKHYTEYDSKNLEYGVYLYQPVIKKLKLEFGYHWLTSDAKGYDEPGEDKATADDADATFEEDGYLFGFNWQLPKIKKLDHDIDAEFEFQKRYYTSKHYLEEDREHAGRVDNNFQMSLAYGIKPAKSWKLSAYYNYYFRDSNTSAVENQAYLSAEKDFHQSQFGVKVTYNFKF